MDRTKVKRVAVGAVAISAALGLALAAWIWFAPCWLGGCAPMGDLSRFSAEASIIMDNQGEPLGTLASVNRRAVPLDSLPEHLPQAFIAVEDRRFYEHGGVDWRRVLGAFASNLKAGGVAEGGSTITMQLARNLFPEDLPYTEQSIRRKLMEARVARQIERNFSKDEILELYVNQIYLGSGAYGVEAAAQTYFGKPASELTLPEAAVIAGLPKAPSSLNPKENPEGARERRDLVLAEMAQAGFITPAQASEARDAPLTLGQSRQVGGEQARGSYFVDRVRRELEEIIGDRFYTAGMRVHTTLDRRIQAAAEEELAQQLDAIEAGRFGSYPHPTYPEAKGTSESGETPYLQGAVVVMDAETGAVHALVGGRDWEDSKFNRATQALRQAGSAFKPFVYAAALERYQSPIHQVEDAPIRLTLSGGRTWEPRNYTGTYEGPMTLRNALARSKNTVTVRIAQEVGMTAVIDKARDLGITTDIPSVPATALGAASVRPVELVRAYAALANGGQRVEPHYVKRIESRSGEVIWEADPERRRVMDPELAFVLTSMMRDVVDRGTGAAVRSAGFRAPAAGKTGTTNAATDVWFVGYTPDLVGGVWIGLDDPKTIVRGASGGTLAAPVWGRIMSRAYQGRRTPREWSPPSGVVSEEVDRATGQVVGESCPPQGPTYTEHFIRVRPPRGTCRADAQYTVVMGDTLWVDEEWNPDGTGTAGGSEVAPGVYWPELDSMRRTRGEEIQVGPGMSSPDISSPGTPSGTVPAPDPQVRGTPGLPREPRVNRPPVTGQPPAADPVRPEREQPRPTEPARPNPARRDPPPPADDDPPELLGKPVIPPSANR